MTIALSRPDSCFPRGSIASADGSVQSSIVAILHHPEDHNVVDVYLLGEAAAALEEHLAGAPVLTTSSCGMCGRVSIDSLRSGRRWSHLVHDGSRSSPHRCRTAAASASARSMYTGGLHAAGLFTPAGDCDASAEDVGRHNAVDKVIGSMLLDDRLPARGVALAVSGRTSFEILQKAWLAGIGLVCAVSAPSSLAIEVARGGRDHAARLRRDGGFNIYAHPERVV